MGSRTRNSVIVGGLVAAGAAAAALLQRERVAALGRKVLRREDAEPEPDAVEESSQESFPASDPPSYGPGV